MSLNEIAAQSTMGLIQSALDAGVKLSEVFIDTVGERWEARGGGGMKLVCGARQSSGKRALGGQGRAL